MQNDLEFRYAELSDQEAEQDFFILPSQLFECRQGRLVK